MSNLERHRRNLHDSEVYRARMEWLRVQATILRTNQELQESLAKKRAEREQIRAEREQIRAEREQIRAETQQIRAENERLRAKIKELMARLGETGEG